MGSNATKIAGGVRDADRRVWAGSRLVFIGMASSVRAGTVDDGAFDHKMSFMLTSRQYEAIGRLTILFNEIDEILTVYLPLILQFGKFDPRQGLGSERTFHARARAMQQVLAIAAESDQIAAIHVSGILPLLERSLQLSAQRNELVHAVVFMDFARNERLLRTRRGEAAPDEALILDLGTEAAWTARQLADACEELLRYYLGPAEDEETLLTDDLGLESAGY
ncbi:MAG TPA: hypothetical protein VGF88_16645 [Acidobacteriaceae bacterium]|jgi:hypothetical protein